MFRWERDPDPAWQAALDGAYPRSGNGSGLVIRWSAGTPEQPTQRWVIDQMIPVEQCYVMDYREARRLPIPAMGQYLQAVERHRGEAWPQWLVRIKDVMERTGCLPVPFWMIQGAHGGHRVTFGKVDQLWAQFTTGSMDPPKPGSLPYAEFDQRVIAGIAAADRWRGTYQSVLAEKAGREAEAEREIRRLMSEALDASLAETLDEVAPGLLEADTPRTDEWVDYKALHNQYLETGELAPAPVTTSAGGATTFRTATREG